MRLEVILKYIGFILLFNGVFLFIAFLISIFNGETSALSLLFTAFICFIFGFFPMIFVEKIEDLSYNEGITIVVLSWVITCIIGAIPYLMWGGEFSVINAWFESVSGFTTTGSSILTDIEVVPKGLLFWRSSTHWIGGIGVIMFILLILPYSQNPRLTLINTEMSELSKGNFKYQARKILQVLAYVYVGLTTLETFSLMLAGMNFFDALNHSFATIATGGFSTRNSSIASFNNLGVEIIIIIFMTLSGIHFGLIYGTIIRDKRNIFSSQVVRTYIIFLIIGSLLVAMKLYFSHYFDVGKSIRYAVFQVVSIGTTTGFATIDTNYWPAFTHIILIYFTIQCAMVGSTSGGLKFDRVFLFFKSVRKQIKLIYHPRAIIIVKIDNKTISEQLERQTMVFLVLYIFVFFTTTAILTSMDIDIYTAFSSSITTIGNVGPGFNKVSSMGNFSGLPGVGKIVLTINMLMGRLEIFNIIAIFMIKKTF
jgi:trk system potassium uptake protein TrkH